MAATARRSGGEPFAASRNSAMTKDRPAPQDFTATMLRPTLLALLLTAALARPAVAQGAKPPAPGQQAPAPVSAEPASTSATFGDWVLRCQRIGDGDKARKFCEVAQVLQLPSTSKPAAEIALGRPPGDPVLHLTAVLPPSVSFPSSVQVASSDKVPHGADLQWRRCLPGGCFADAVVADDSVRAWRTAGEPGQLTFKDAAGREVTLPVSFRGLAQALDALMRS